MKTDELIDLMVNDLRPLPSLTDVLLLGVICGTMIAALAFASMIGPRVDIGIALNNGRFIYKLVVTLTLVACAAVVLEKTGRPGVSIGAIKWWLSLPLLLISSGVVLELHMSAPETWIVNATGKNGLKCLAIIPLLSLAPLGCIIHGLRLAAPSHPGGAGTVAGLMAGGIAATFYALHCDDDSLLFVVTWYVPAIAIAALIGYICGHRLLRW